MTLLEEMESLYEDLHILEQFQDEIEHVSAQIETNFQEESSDNAIEIDDKIISE